MGAVAITTLAGALILQLGPPWSFVVEIRPFLLGFTLFFWATATWWIPLLVVLGFWRHIVGGITLPHRPEGYSPRYWGMASRSGCTQ